jgi:hypothetical protein
MHRYIAVTPRNGETVCLSLAEYPIDGTSLAEKLKSGEELSWESLHNDRVANHPDPGTEAGREKATNDINDRCARDICQLLNALIGKEGNEFSESSTFQLVEMREGEAKFVAVVSVRQQGAIGIFYNENFEVYADEDATRDEIFEVWLQQHGGAWEANHLSKYWKL